MTAQIVTANRLGDGIVVYLGPDSTWTPRIEDSEIAHGKDAAAALLGRAEAPEQRTRVVGPYLMEAIEGSDGARAASIREIIRALGPSVRTDLGRQAELP